MGESDLWTANLNRWLQVLSNNVLWFLAYSLPHAAIFVHRCLHWKTMSKCGFCLFGQRCDWGGGVTYFHPYFLRWPLLILAVNPYSERYVVHWGISGRARMKQNVCRSRGTSGRQADRRLQKPRTVWRCKRSRHYTAEDDAEHSLLCKTWGWILKCFRTDKRITNRQGTAIVAWGCGKRHVCVIAAQG